MDLGDPIRKPKDTSWVKPHLRERIAKERKALEPKTAKGVGDAGRYIWSEDIDMVKRDEEGMKNANQGKS